MASSKWKLHQFYNKHNEVRKYLPDTALFSLDTLKQFMDKYSEVYIKPDTRHGGNGVTYVRKTETGYSYTRIKGRAAEVTSGITALEEIYKKVIKTAIDKTYIIQQAISLAAINNRPFDIRSMLMRKPYRKWGFYGFFAKVAGPVNIITNVGRSGGSVITLEEALRRSLQLTPAAIKEKMKELRELSFIIANRFNKYKASTTQIGIDFAVDLSGNIWIIEVNFDLPNHSGNAFAKLPDKSNYLKIRKMKRYLAALRLKRKAAVYIVKRAGKK
ncbi:YheC/YheD family protein [Paenibacillus sp. N4]|uniref:YheC/YheD family protein n=1 Tax=Paenibacillus vietnamensis TaxID=2590547 RepID=UPI001CD04CEE|nr:YheC/YheD family protein [Paenibacillus vietnamensis]MCA0755940.1 YheC/YheD family protein [Paenibacillus vietnamensis]